jgi:hypothetical protein
MSAMILLSSHGGTWFHALVDGAQRLDLTIRLSNAEAMINRTPSIDVRRRLAEQWNAS